MATDPDDEALSWGGEKDPTHVDAKIAAEPAVDDSELPEQTSSALLIVYGIFGGAFILFVIGWIISIAHIGMPVDGLVPQFMYRVGEGLAIASPIMWFLGVLLLTRHSKVWQRLLWMLLGLAITAPWPFIFGGV